MRNKNMIFLKPEAAMPWRLKSEAGPQLGSGEAKWPQNFTKSSTHRGQKVMLISHLAQMNNFGVMSLKP